MCALAANDFRVEGGEAHDGSCSPAAQRQRGATWATTRCDPGRPLHLLSHGQVCVLAASEQTVIVWLSRLPAADNPARRRSTRRNGWSRPPVTATVSPPSSPACRYGLVCGVWPALV